MKFSHGKVFSVAVMAIIVTVCFGDVRQGQECPNFEVPLLNSMDAPLVAKLDMTKLSSQLKVYIYEEIRKVLDYTMKDIISDISKLKDETKQLNVVIEEKVKNVTMELTENLRTPTVTFTARDLKFDRNLIGKTLVFPNLIVNYDDGYDNTTGVFTAPYSGMYLLTVQLCPEMNDSIHAFIKVGNGKILADLNFRNNVGEHGPCVSSNGVDFLTKGDKAWVFCTHANSNGDVIYIGGHGNSFSGTLIHR
ncbi:hypothetical protein AM593_00724, partial [Mytilus galloprovincialis]